MKRLEARRYEVGDCLLFPWQAHQAFDVDPARVAQFASREMPGVAWTFYDGETPVACGGLIDKGTRIREAWAMVAAGATARQRVQLIEYGAAAIANDPSPRIEATVRDGWDAACRTILRLGFVFEGVMRKAAWDGADLHLFARVR